MLRHGTRIGFDLDLNPSVADPVAVPVIASGGAGYLQQLVDGVTEGHAKALLAASLLHFGQFTIGQAKEAMANAGIEIRR